MAVKQLIYNLVSGARASGNSDVTGTTGLIGIGDAASFSQIVIMLDVTTVTTLTSLDLAVGFYEILTATSTREVRVQTRGMGLNVNGVFTVGTWALGVFATVTSATAVPYLEVRGLSSAEIIPETLRLTWTVVGTNPTFSLQVWGIDPQG